MDLMLPIKHVHFFCADMLPLEGLPTDGGGLRSWQFIQGLEAHGYKVTYSMPGVDTFLNQTFADRVPESIRAAAWTFDNQDDLIARFQPDAVFFANPELNALQKDYDLPILCDMNGPRLIEMSLGRGDDDSLEERNQDLNRQIASYLRSDFFTCGGRNQRYYFVSLFLVAGFSINDITIEVVPLSLAPEMPSFEKDLEARRFIYCGGFYPWQDPYKGLYALSDVLKEEQKGALSIYGGPHNLNSSDGDDFEVLKKNLSHNAAISFEGFLPWQDILEKYRTGYVAFEVMGKSLERELAFTTRTINFLWSGLPVIYNNFAELSEYIEQYEAGWCVDPANEEDIKRAVREALHDPDMVLEYSRNAQKLVQEHFNWEKTIEPVVAYLKNPVLRRNDLRFSETALGNHADPCMVEAADQLREMLNSRSMRMARFISKAYNLPKCLFNYFQK